MRLRCFSIAALLCNMLDVLISICFEIINTHNTVDMTGNTLNTPATAGISHFIRLRLILNKPNEM